LFSFHRFSLLKLEDINSFCCIYCHLAAGKLIECVFIVSHFYYSYTHAVVLFLVAPFRPSVAEAGPRLPGPERWKAELAWAPTAASKQSVLNLFGDRYIDRASHRIMRKFCHQHCVHNSRLAGKLLDR